MKVNNGEQCNKFTLAGREIRLSTLQSLFSKGSPTDTIILGMICIVLEIGVSSHPMQYWPTAGGDCFCCFYHCPYVVTLPQSETTTDSWGSSSSVEKMISAVVLFQLLAKEIVQLDCLLMVRGHSCWFVLLLTMSGSKKH